MVMTLLTRILADLIFEAAATTRRSFEQEMSRYFEQRGLPATPRQQATAR
jgi:hypothetical protein